MLELFKLLIGITFLAIGIPIGDFLARQTKEELPYGRVYFILLISIGLFGGFIGLIIGSDVLLFTMFFIAIVTSRSMEKKKSRKKR